MMTSNQQNPAGAGRTAATKTMSLADVLRGHGAVPTPELLKTLHQVLADLEQAHSQGVLHRDISPARIVFDGETWRLTDYGVSKVGTVRYMSPERCQGKPMDARSDIYSLGVVLFEAATGRVPFDAEMKFQIMEAHISNPPPSPRAINPQVPPELEQVILKALSKNPSVRFQTATEFKQALDDIVPVAETPVAEEEPEPKPVQSAPAKARTEPRRVKPLVYLVPLAVIVTVLALLLVSGAFGGPRVPQVTGLSRDAAEQTLRSKGLSIEAESVDDTLPAGVVVTQIPAAGERASRSRPVALKVSSGMVAMPVLSGLSLDEALAKLAKVALDAARVDSQYSDSHGVGAVISGGAKPGTKLAPRTGVSLTVSNGRATCPQCGSRREARAKFCTKCGYQF
jgi:eukaryotic-like serine/threonine-protein kinase